MSRPSKYSDKIVSQICERIASGKSLRSICAGVDMPALSTVIAWLAKREDFQAQYARAREAQADAIFDEILDIADDGKNDTYLDEDGNRRTDHDVVARSRLRIDARKWMAGKLRPKKYGEKIEHELTGKDGGPIEASVAVVERRIVRTNTGD